MRLQKLQVQANIPKGILGGADQPKGTEGDQLRFDFDTAAVGILPGNEIGTPVAQQAQPLRDRIAAAARLKHQIRTHAVVSCGDFLHDRLGVLAFQVENLGGSQLPGQRFPLRVMAGGDGDYMRNAERGQISHREGADRTEALHHSDPCLFYFAVGLAA